MSSTEQETMQGIEKLVSDDVYEAAQTSSKAARVIWSKSVE